MENPNAEIEIKRDSNGNILGFAYKLNDGGKDDKRALEFTEMVVEMFASENRQEDHSTKIDVPIDFNLGDEL